MTPPSAKDSSQMLSPHLNILSLCILTPNPAKKAQALTNRDILSISFLFIIKKIKLIFLKDL